MDWNDLPRDLHTVDCNACTRALAGYHQIEIGDCLSDDASGTT